jgi:hypothetical protein
MLFGVSYLSNFLIWILDFCLGRVEELGIDQSGQSAVIVGRTPVGGGTEP